MGQSWAKWKKKNNFALYGRIIYSLQNVHAKLTPDKAV